jgi:hypothetical protein
VNQDRQIGRLLLERQMAALGIRKGPEILHETRQDARVVQHGGQPIIIARVDTVDQPLEPALKNGNKNPKPNPHGRYQPYGGGQPDGGTALAAEAAA